MAVSQPCLKILLLFLLTVLTFDVSINSTVDSGVLLNFLSHFTIVLPDPDPRPQPGRKGHHGGDHVRKQESHSSCRAPRLHRDPSCGTSLLNANPAHSTPVDHAYPSTGKKFTLFFLNCKHLNLDRCSSLGYLFFFYSYLHFKSLFTSADCGS